MNLGRPLPKTGEYLFMLDQFLNYLLNKQIIKPRQRQCALCHKSLHRYTENMWLSQINMTCQILIDLSLIRKNEFL